MTKLAEIEGIGATYAAKLGAVGITSTEALLEAAGSIKGRDELAAKCGLDSKVVLEWVNRADLFRIKGIGGQYSDLLEVAGVDTVPELARRSPQNLLDALLKANEAKNLVRRPPTLDMVTSWVAEAKTLPRAVFY